MLAGFHVQLGDEGYRPLQWSGSVPVCDKLRDCTVSIKVCLPALRLALLRLHSFLCSKRGNSQEEKQAGASEVCGLHNQIGKTWLAFLESLLARVIRNNSAFDQLKMMK